MFFVSSNGTTGTDSLWRHMGGEWERIFVSTLSEPALGNISLVQLSPGFADDETVYVALRGSSPKIYRSTDKGNDWDSLTRNPTELYTWLVVDEEIVFAGGNGAVYYTENHGRREWEKESVTGLATAISFAMSPGFTSDESLLVGDNTGGVFLSEDMGDSWDQLEDDLAGNGNTYVMFDMGYATRDASGYLTIYAASGDMAARCIIDTDEDWEDQEWKEFTDISVGEASGLRVGVNGELYVCDRTPVDLGEEGGVWRTINSRESDIDDVFFELVQEELKGDEELYTFYITEGSLDLWALNDQDGAQNDIWTWEDYLVEEAELDTPWSNTGLDDTSEVTLMWKDLENSAGDESADEYELRYGKDDAFDVKTIKVTDIDDTDYFVDGLDAGTVYYWKVRATAPYRSPWSRVWNFTTKLARPAEPEASIPEPGAQNVILQPSFYWNRVSNATGYEIQVATDTAFTNLVAEATVDVNSWVCDTRLNYSTGYYWRVRALKDDLVVSGWKVASFTTMEKAKEPPPPVEITPAPPAPEIIVEPVLPVQPTPMWVWAIIGIGAALVIAVIVLIIRTRRVV
jgi:hypothetical protein